MMNFLLVDKAILNALEEDMSNEDLTTNCIIKGNRYGKVELIAREDGIIAGLPVFERVFKLLGDVKTSFYVEDGDKVEKDKVIGVIEGNVNSILSGERTALNFIQRMSGIATLTYKFVKELQGTNAKLLDTRKTTPGLRYFEKYAVRMGGGCNHRFNLSDGILIKDNHIDAAGGIREAVEAVKDKYEFSKKIEVECESIEMVKEALEAKVDIIMLDNMDIKTIKECVSLINGRVLIEASGDMALDNIRTIAETGVDYISVGKLTHSYKSLNLSMKNLVCFSDNKNS